MLKTDSSIHDIRDGAGRLKPVPPVEVEYHAPRAASATLHRPKRIRVREQEIKELLTEIEGKLPNVAEASQELGALRILLRMQLTDATKLRLESPATYL